MPRGKEPRSAANGASTASAPSGERRLHRVLGDARPPRRRCAACGQPPRLSGPRRIPYQGGVPSRRDFLLASAATLAASACRTERAPDGVLPSAPPVGELSLRDLVGAERVADVRYTDEERGQLLATLDESLRLIRARRRFVPDNALPPACVFDPRLPGRSYPLEGVSLPGAAASSPPLPASDEDIAFAPLTHLSEWLRRREVTSERLTSLSLRRLRRFGPRLECVVTLLEERALQQARDADREIGAGRWRGPLHGVPWGAKDLFDTAGVRTSWGAEPYRRRVPSRDAAVVTKLEEAGAVLVAKLSMGALAYGDRWYGGRTRNPWNPKEGSIGSSAGPAAAVSAGLVGFALGTETLGSILSPAMRCGVVGLRPTFGRVSRAGAMALCWSMDKVGPLCRGALDTALVLAALTGEDHDDPASLATSFAAGGQRSVEGLQVGYDPRWFDDDIANELDREMLRALPRLGVELRELELPDLPWEALLLVLFAESAAAFEPLSLSDDDDLLVWQAPEAWPNTFRRARLLSAVDLVQADRLRRRAMVAMEAAFEGVDAILSPTYAGPLLVAANFTGHPALTLPVGLLSSPSRAELFLSDEERARAETGQGELHRVPHGVTLHAPLFREDTLVSLGAALEDALGFRALRPQLL